MSRQFPEYDYPEYVRNREPEPLPDWKLLREVTPWLIVMFGWLCWAAYLVVPTLSGSHGTTLYPLENNLLFVAMGLVLMLASQTAWRVRHLIRSALWTAVIFFLSYWF